MSQLKRIARCLPRGYVRWLKRQYFALQIKNNRFTSEEQEFRMLDDLVQPGDWVIDVGANVGTYSLRFSQLVGPTGRVFAIEPVAETFELLVANSQCFPYQNITLLNIAASDEPRLVQMEVPISSDGILRHHRAHIVDKDATTGVFAAPLDAFALPERVKLVKIDAEGHELPVLKGMRELLVRDRPTLIVEASSKTLIEFLSDFGYECHQEAGSCNYVFRCEEVIKCC